MTYPCLGLADDDVAPPPEAESRVAEAPGLRDPGVEDLVLLLRVSCSEDASEEDSGRECRWICSRILDGFGANTEQVTTAL